jgi:hypothetical protein
MTRWALGLDLGQVSDFSALAALRERAATPEERRESVDPHHDLLGLVRWPLGSAYTAIVAAVEGYAGRVREGAKAAPIALVIDGTGVGRPVVDMFVASRQLAKLRVEIVAVTITSGHAVSLDYRDDGVQDWHVPKRELVGAVQMLLQARRLHIAPRLPEAATLEAELRNFKLKFTASANLQYEAWREGDHDDLVLAEAMASWALLRGPLGEPFQAATGGKRRTVETRG